MIIAADEIPLLEKMVEVTKKEHQVLFELKRKASALDICQFQNATAVLVEVTFLDEGRVRKQKYQLRAKNGVKS